MSLSSSSLVIKFYRATGQFGFLSNLYLCSVELDGRTFRSAEDAYQYAKPKEKKVAEWLISAPAPRFTALAGHTISHYDVSPTFDKIKRMKRVLHAKFIQNTDLREKLLATDDAILIEDSKTDRFWGIGKKSNGKNMLGILLMELRKTLQKKGKGS